MKHWFRPGLVLLVICLLLGATVAPAEAAEAAPKKIANTPGLEAAQALSMITEILKEIVAENSIKLFNVQHIAVGFVDGDLVIVK